MNNQKITRFCSTNEAYVYPAHHYATFTLLKPIYYPTTLWETIISSPVRTTEINPASPFWKTHDPLSRTTLSVKNFNGCICVARLRAVADGSSIKHEVRVCVDVRLLLYYTEWLKIRFTAIFKFWFQDFLVYTKK